MNTVWFPATNVTILIGTTCTWRLSSEAVFMDGRDQQPGHDGAWVCGAPLRTARSSVPGSGLVVLATYSSKRPVASRSRSYRRLSGNGGNQDSRRTIQLS